MEFFTYRIADVFDRFNSGKNITEEKISDSGQYPVYGGNGLRGYTNTSNFNGECILIGRQGAKCGNVRYFNGEGYMTDHAIVGVCKSNHNTQFMNYALASLNLNRLSGQAAQPGLSVGMLKKQKILLPSFENQTKIANIIFGYNNVIENNNKRIDILEQMAENLYKEWFVRFRFPDHETAEFVNGPLGKIPSDFSVIKMNEAFDYYIGGGWGEDDCSETFSEKAYVIRGTDFPKVQKGDLSTCPLRYHKKSNYSSRALKENDIIIEVSGGTAEQPVGRTIIVTNDTIERLGNKVICASFCKLIRLNQEIISPYFFYYWMQFLYDTRIIDKFQLQSTGIINFKFEYFLRKGDIMLPPKSLMKEFETKVKSFYDEISLLAKQNENLIKQRDLLLPRLMSGKLEV